MKYLGSHLGLSAPDYFLSTVREAEKLGETTFMFYTGAPQNTVRKELSALRIEEGKAYWESLGYPLDKLVVHAPYIINLGAKKNPDSYAFAKSFLIDELRRTASFGAKLLVLHPGSDLGEGEEEGFACLHEALEEVLSQDGTDVTICLETMAGKGHELGREFSFLRRIIDASSHKGRLGVTLDTCHIHDAGYDLSNPKALLDLFDKEIGLEHLKVVHLNDSKNQRGSHKDRHENLGYGAIGYEVLKKLASDPRLEEIPIILETPYVDGKCPYAKEISMLRNGFEENWKDTLEE